MFKTWKDKLEVQWLYLTEALHFWWCLVRYNADSRTTSDCEKMQYVLLRDTHIIEKGLSMRNPRIGFGQAKVLTLIGRLKTYCQLYLQTDAEFLSYPLSAIQTYIEYMTRSEVNIRSIEQEYETLLNMAGHPQVSVKSGIEEVDRRETLRQCAGNFEALLNSRHSVRYFSDEEVSDELLVKALSLAQRTPSACNRQGWKTHIYRGAQSIDLLTWQGGSRGFENEIRCSIVVTANLKAFKAYEPHQAYVDGGLYAMNLINALHSLGLGTIPLSCGFKHKKLKQLSSFGIPDNEVPIVIIGIGHLPERYKVAISERKSIEQTNTFHTL